MRTAVQNVPNICLAVANPRKFDVTSLRGWIFAYWTTLEVCLAVANPFQRRSKREIRQRISPCTDFAYWTIASFKVCIAVANPYQRRSRIQQRISQFRIQQRISHAWIKSNWTKPITIDAHIVVNAPEVMDVEEGKLEEELVDKPGTTIGTKFSVLHCVRIPF